MKNIITITRKALSFLSQHVPDTVNRARLQSRTLHTTGNVAMFTYDSAQTARDLASDLTQYLPASMRDDLVLTSPHTEALPTEDRTALVRAVNTLHASERGRNVLRGLLKLITQHGADGLDSVNQAAVLVILRAQFGPFAGSTREEIKRAIGASAPGTIIGSALTACESFVRGFEDDEAQEPGSINKLLDQIERAQAIL